MLYIALICLRATSWQSINLYFQFLSLRLILKTNLTIPSLSAAPFGASYLKQFLHNWPEQQHTTLILLYALKIKCKSCILHVSFSPSPVNFLRFLQFHVLNIKEICTIYMKITKDREGEREGVCVK